MSSSECFCCYSGNCKLANVTELCIFTGKRTSYMNIIVECFQIQFEQINKELYLICEMCITRLKDAHQFKQQVENAFNRIQGVKNQINQNEYNIQIPFVAIKCEPISENEADTEEPILSVRIKEEKNSESENEKEVKHCNTTESFSKNNQDVMDKIKDMKIIFDCKNGYSCNVCNKGFERLKCLKKHMACHFPYFVCPICTKTFVDDKNYAVHLQRHQENKIEHKCHICNRTFMGKKNLRRHILRHKNPFEYKCSHCPEKFKSQHHKACHLIQSHGEDIKFYCKYCNKPFPTPNSLYHHVRTHGSKTRGFVCDICSLKFSSKSQVLKHMKIHGIKANVKHSDKKDSLTGSQDLDVNCDKSSSEFKNRTQNSLLSNTSLDDDKNNLSIISNLTFHTNNLSNHNLVENSKTSNDILIKQNTHSKETLSTIENLKMDTAIKNLSMFHVDENILTCNVCNENFNGFRNLKMHMRVHSPKYICQICTKMFLDEKSYVTHLQRHTQNDTTHTCSICNKSIIGVDNFKKHMNNHKISTKYTCSYCTDRFSSYHKKILHLIQVHGESTKYDCKICKKSFATSDHRNKHIQANHHITKYSCELCDTSFTTKSKLSRHLRSHSEEKDFHCELCKKSFTRKCGLKEHLKIHDKLLQHCFTSEMFVEESLPNIPMFTEKN